MIAARGGWWRVVSVRVVAASASLRLRHGAIWGRSLLVGCVFVVQFIILWSKGMSEIEIYDGGQVTGGLQIRTMDDLSRVSKMLAQSRFFTDAIDAAQCGVKVLAGTEMGFGAFASMTGIHIIKGKPSVGANLMAAAVKRHPNYNYRVLEHSEQICRIEFYEKWDGKMQPVGTSEFTLADAKKAGTQNLDKYARNMLFARAMSNGVKWYCPDVFDVPVYTPEELGASVDSEGDVIEVESEPVISEQQKKRLFAIAKKNAWPTEEVKKTILDVAGVDSSAKIPKRLYDDVVAVLEGIDYTAAPVQTVEAEVA
jgi:hypothetical protein